ncbi:sensor histidine kinase [Corynebacterium phocae]|nr:sensor histidine kinase [Corynebacterium phocae]
MFASLLVFGVASAVADSTLTPLVTFLAVALAALYFVRNRLWGLGALTFVWAGLMFHGQDFMWLEFPLVFLYLRYLPRWVRLPAVGGLWAVAAFFPAWRYPENWTVAHAVGPAIGTLFGVAVFFSYVALRQEAERYRDLAAELRSTQDELAQTENLAGRLAERERLSREIHDTVAQGLSSIVLMSRAAAGATNPSGHIATIHEVAEDSLGQARRFVAELSSPPALPEALGALVQSHRDRARALGESTAFDLQIEGDTSAVPEKVATVLERAAREGLSNAAKHAHASRVVVTLSVFPDRATLDVADDGVGCSGVGPSGVGPSGAGPSGLGPSGAGPANGSGGYGLPGLRRRVDEAGGRLDVIDRNPGTVLSVNFLLEA